MQYKNIVGQQEVKQHLRRMWLENKVPHGLLFSGPEGCGNLPAAFVFAQHLFCEKKQEEGPCGTCPPCLKVSRLAHPDLHLVFPIAKSKEVRTSDDVLKEFRDVYQRNPYLTLEQWFREVNAENKQPVIPVDEASAIIRKLSYTSYEGGYKVMIVWQPERMNTEAANRLLKVLEEPPEKTIFILVANYPDQLLSTIFSRVQQVRFRACTDDEIAGALKEQFGVNEEVALQTAVMADGSYSEAIRLMDENEENVSFLNNFQAFMRLALRFDAAKATDWIESNAVLGREKQKQFLQYGLQVFRDALMYNFGSPELVRLSGQEKEFLGKFAPFVNRKNYEKLVEEFNSNYYYIERNANPKVLFMDLLLKVNELINLKKGT